jgi:hypothetical protein
MAKGIDTALLKAALYGYQVQSERLEATIADIHAQLGHRGPGVSLILSCLIVLPRS